jgi:phage/plasmid-like protein (TIGR03299 family)
MAHNLDMTNGRANIAFLGSKSDVWHHLGQEMQPGMTIDQWARAAGLDWNAIKVPAIADLSGAAFDHIPQSARMAQAGDRSFMVRSDNGAPLGEQVVSNVYQAVQPREVLAWFEQYIGVDDRFALDVAGSLKGGSIIWATAVYRDALTVAGDQHVARVLMSTTFDASQATRNQMTTTRVVCNNTLRAAHGDRHNAVVTTRHNTKFDAKKVGAELAQLAQSIATFKAVGDAMAQVTMTAAEVQEFFKTLLKIPFDAKKDDISTRKLNQFKALSSAFSTTRSERNAAIGSPIDVWTALQAVTRYVDHDRAPNNAEKAFTSAQFGSGDAMKGHAMELLLPRVRDLVAA